MYNYLKGRVTEVDTATITLDVGGIGFHINATEPLANAVRVGDTTTVYTHLDIKENAHTLYGFAGTAERELFLTITSVAGVGPKSAMALLSFGQSFIINAIGTGNVKAIAQAKGISTRTADKIILELKNKILKKFTVTEEPATPQQTVSSAAQDAIFGLISLGVARQEATDLVMSMGVENKTAEELIIEALGKRGKT